MFTMPTEAVDLRRSTDRFSSQYGWLDSKHSFSFSRHYDPANTHHGLLLVSNDDIVAPGTGFETHPHRDMEIVTWVLSGSLVHQDSEGHNGIIYPGLAQRMSAGTGILHSEKNDSWVYDTNRSPHADPVRFIQMWVVPDTQGIKPGYEQLEISPETLGTGFVTVATGMDKYLNESAIRIRNKYAAFHVAKLSSGQEVTLPEAPYQHLFVATGSITLEGSGRMNSGDAARMTATGGHKVTALEPSEVLLWEMHATLNSR
ncbi:hypothetical protein AUCHE_25_00300 [Austwickia chelonae NBRC 105200]|uniref:Pirin N-terminal domain-containing protein n=2 Tax=Austwickia TaxID=1184606 RepID=K6VRR2_9MICO|nr:pirin-like bicupin family protein [Austwickia chelonae]GAB79449.1 hypothetical protein AUCHE_25_00300 [Austwickia chelonae NBRC 105200]